MIKDTFFSFSRFGKLLYKEISENWAEADAIRDKLKAMNIELKDTPMGVKWNYISE